MLNYVVATFSEAKPIIDFFKLKKRDQINEFQIYDNYQKSLSLIISGIGKINSASAVTFLELKSKNKNNIWINIGIAGGKLNVGELSIINKIIDNSTNKAWYPFFSFKTDIKKSSCKTFDKPEFKYRNYLNDMELSGFFSTCLKFTGLEFIHSFKIISDNKIDQTSMLNKNTIMNLIKKHMNKIQDISVKLLISRSALTKDTISEQINNFFDKNNLNSVERNEILYLLYLWNLRKKKRLEISKLSKNKLVEILKYNLK